MCDPKGSWSDDKETFSLMAWPDFPPRPFFCFANVEKLASVYGLTGDFPKSPKGEFKDVGA